MSESSPAILEYASPSGRGPFRWLYTLGWAAYLGVSWTWCIGMFLPVLLIRDYGVAGWWAFAIPNVVGAAAMARVIRSKGHSEQLVQAHRPAIRLFSIVTLAFHVFFIRWIMSSSDRLSIFPSWVGSANVTFLWPAALILPFFLVFATLRSRADRCVATAILMASIVIALVGARGASLLQQTFLVTWPPQSTSFGGIPHGMTNLAYLTSVMIFGFMLCPYLDQTFHRARQRSSHPRRAFSIGFGVFFAAMILMTLGYSGWAYVYFLMPQYSFSFPQTAGVGLVLLIYFHLMIQSGVTMELHLRDATRPDGRELTAAAAIFLVLAYAGGIFASLANPNGEDTYRIFMGFYALIFPAYVLICMQPWRKVTAAPSLRQWVFFAGALVIAGPLFLMGITGENRMPMFCGLLVVLVMAAAERVLPAIAMRKANA